MSLPSTVLSSSEIVPFKPKPANQPKAGFAQASKASLKLLTSSQYYDSGRARAGAALYQYFKVSTTRKPAS